MELEPYSHGTLSNLILIILFPIITLILFLLIILIVIFLLKKKYFHCKCEICHSYVTSSWSQTIPNLSDWYTNLLQNSPTKTIHIHVLNNIITANPKNVEYMLKTNFDNYPKGKPFSSILGDLLGHGIFNVDGDAWRFQRKMASLELDRQSVRSFSYQVVRSEINGHLLPYLSDQAEAGAVVDLQEVFRGFSFSTMCQFSFGVEIRELEAVASLEEFSSSFDLASRLSAQRALEVCSVAWRAKRILRIGAEKRLRDAIAKVDDLAMAVIELKRSNNNNNYNKSVHHPSSSNNNNNNNKDLLSRFMGTVGHDNDRYLRDIIVSFLLAGRDTVASALTSFFLLIARHPEVESKILSESRKVLGTQLELTKFDQLRELQYLQAAVYESMRLYAPVQFDSKFAVDDDTLPDGTRVRKGDRVTYHPYAMGRMEEIWGKDCLEFKPQRWLNNEGVFCQQCPYKYPVFQAGVRVCLGKEMALVEIKCVILSVLKDFHVVDLLANGNEDNGDCNIHHQVPRFSPGLTATFKGGLPVKLRKRTT